MTLTPSLNRSKQQPMRVEKSANGVFRVKNAYSRDYEYFKGRPLPKVDSTKNGSSKEPDSQAFTKADSRRPFSFNRRKKKFGDFP